MEYKKFTFNEEEVKSYLEKENPIDIKKEEKDVFESVETSNLNIPISSYKNFHNLIKLDLTKINNKKMNYKK